MEALEFFVVDSIKIFLLLIVIVFSISFVRSYIPPERVRNLLSRRRGYVGNLFAAFLGIATPFCTCSAIPLFLGLISAGVPLGITFTFLVASPMINEVAVVMLLGIFGWKVALIYVVSGFIIAIVSGIIIGKLKLESLVEISYISVKPIVITSNTIIIKDRIHDAFEYTKDIVKKIWLFILIGIGIGALIHGYVPADFISTYAGRNTWYAVPLAVLIGIPLYSNAAGVLPLVGVLTEKGVEIGTVLAFMMAVTALSLPEFLILRKVMRPKLIIVFAGIVGLGIIITGYFFNAFLGA